MRILYFQQTKPGEKPVPVETEQNNSTVLIKEEPKDEPGQQQQQQQLQQQVNSNSGQAAGAVAAPNPGAFFSGGMKVPVVKKRKLGK